MTNNSPLRVVRHRGLSLLELTVVIATILAFVAILFVGTRGWLRDSDRSCCVMTIRNVQLAARSYQNLYGYKYGGRPYEEGGTQDIAMHLHTKGYIEDAVYDQASGASKCSGSGTYTCPKPDVFPEQGELYMTCSLAGPRNHQPKNYLDW